jgi:hypothetical protein
MDKDLLFKALYPHTQNIAISKLLGVSISSVENKAFKMGLKKSLQFLKDTTKINWIEGKQEKSKNCHFKTGHIPHNKSKKMPKELIDKVKHTWFKEGQLPHNSYKQESGIVKVRTQKGGHKYKWIKVSHGKWELLHRQVWEQANGKIQKGYIVIFKDGNSMNCELNNLKCITLVENMQRNNINNLPEEIKTNIILTRTLNRKIKKLSPPTTNNN